MGRFPWTQGHLKHSENKLNGVTHEWFAKDHGEPSRQALNDMIKDYSSLDPTNADSSITTRSRSRTNTVNSSFSVYGRSLSDASNDLASRPPSQHSFVGDGMPLQEQQESTAKSLLAKGTRILKRQGSKLNLLPSQIEDKSTEPPTPKVGDMSPTHGLQRQPTLSSRRLKRSISGPFAFHHLTHADQARFQSLNTVSTTDLTLEFDAVQSAQTPDTQIRGIPVADLPIRKDVPRVERGTDEPTSPTTDAIPYLPITPPRPQPPPKDGLMSPYTPTDFRMSRSMENFSRPTRLSATASDISPTTTSTQRLSAMSPVNQANALAKPLPHLPGVTVVHAVSTGDDVALPLRTAPLPSPPKPVMEVVQEEAVEEPEGSPTIKPRYQQQLARMSKQRRKRRSQSSGEMDFDVPPFNQQSRLPTPISSTFKDAGGLSHAPNKSVSAAAIAAGTEDWEDAIDYSWDHAAELEDAEDSVVPPAISRLPSSLSLHRGGTYLVVEQNHTDEASSSSSTPLMMQLPHKVYREEPRSASSHAGEPASPLLGLGIDSLQPFNRASLNDTATHANSGMHHRISTSDVYQSRTMRSPVSMMSKSSSQESIIASIFGTHRSSNSSTSLSDFAHLATGSFGGSMEHLKLELEDFPFAPVLDKHIREGSQDTIREDSQLNKSIEALGNVGVMPTPLTTIDASPSIKHDRGASTSQVPQIPERKSSMADAATSSGRYAGRKRAATSTSRPRLNSRVSYSLFPTAIAT